MPDHSLTLLWLLTGGLVVVFVGLTVVGLLLMWLRRDLLRSAKMAVPGMAAVPGEGIRGAITEKDIAAVFSATKIAAQSPSAPFGTAAGPAISGEDIAAALAEELAAFQAVYRADLAKILAEIRGADAPRATPAERDGRNRLDDAIALAKAGHDSDTLTRLCDLERADAEALVRFHGPERLT